jgi:polysaccharide pyruvyl transferase WcaK-like protein
LAPDAQNVRLDDSVRSRRPGDDALEESESLRIAHFGTFDVENYGDLLFPLVLERRLSDLCEGVVHISPAGATPAWEDCVPTIGFDEFLREGPEVDGVVIGGGQIMRASPTPLGIYDRGGVSPFVAYPSLWLGAAYVAARDALPLCWNAPGVPALFDPVAARFMRWTGSVTDHASVRDEESRRFLEEAGVEGHISVVPDTAVEVARLWGEDEISAAYKEAFAHRGKGLPERTIAFHVNARLAGEDLSAVAGLIDRICEKFEATPVLLAIGPSHGDTETQRAIAGEMASDPLVVDRPRSLREVASCIARSELYVGSSLHGMITACSFGRRCILISAREDHKYAGFLDHFGLASWEVRSWAKAEQKIDDLLDAPADAWERALERIDPSLDEHWRGIRKALLSGGEGRENVARNTSKRGAIELFKRISAEQTEYIGDDHSENTQVFGGFVAGNLRDAHARLRRAEQDVAKLTRWMETLEDQTTVLIRSRRWRVGDALVNLHRRALLKPIEPVVTQQMSEILGRFRAWREADTILPPEKKE